MSTADSRYEIFKGCYEQLKKDGVDVQALANMLFLGQSSRGDRNKIYDKVRGELNRGVTKTDALAIQLLVLLNEQGFSLPDFTFDENGRLLSAPKRKRSS